MKNQNQSQLKSKKGNQNNVSETEILVQKLQTLFRDSVAQELVLKKNDKVKYGKIQFPDRFQQWSIVGCDINSDCRYVQDEFVDKLDLPQLHGVHTYKYTGQVDNQTGEPHGYGRKLIFRTYKTLVFDGLFQNGAFVEGLESFFFYSDKKWHFVQQSEINNTAILMKNKVKTEPVLVQSSTEEEEPFMIEASESIQLAETKPANGFFISHEIKNNRDSMGIKNLDGASTNDTSIKSKNQSQDIRDEAQKWQKKLDNMSDCDENEYEETLQGLEKHSD